MPEKKDPLRTMCGLAVICFALQRALDGKLIIAPCANGVHMYYYKGEVIIRCSRTF